MQIVVPWAIGDHMKKRIAAHLGCVQRVFEKDNSDTSDDPRGKPSLQ